MSEPPPPCAGVVLLRWASGEAECLLVETHDGEWGFPKGKRHRGESVADNALRELREETGLGPDAIALRVDLAFDEPSNKGNLAVRYLAATLRADSPVRHAPDEHRSIGWVRADDALRRLRPSRAEVLRAALASLGPPPPVDATPG